MRRGKGVAMASEDNWYMEDYRSRRASINLSLEQEHRLVNYSLIALAGITAFFGSPYAKLGGWVCPLLFSAALLFLAIVILYLRHDLLIAYNAQYAEIYIRQMIASKLPKEALSWEKYISMKRGGKKKSRVFHGLLAISRFAPILIPSVIFFGAGAKSLFSTSVQLDPGGPPYILPQLLFYLWCVGFAFAFGTGIIVWKEERKLATESKKPLEQSSAEETSTD